jgi:probable phosphoglycerate mutase
MAEKVWFIRHGESEANTRHVFAGQRENSRLTEVGKQQAREAAKELKARGIKIGKIISSPLLRARETAEILKEEAGLAQVEILIDSRIAEFDMGSLTGTLFHKISSKQLVSALGAEDAQSFMDRVHNLIDELVNADGEILLVSHAGVGRVIEAKRRGMKPETFYDLDPYPNAKVIELLLK